MSAPMYTLMQVNIFPRKKFPIFKQKVIFNELKNMFPREDFAHTDNNLKYSILHNFCRKV